MQPKTPGILGDGPTAKALATRLHGHVVPRGVVVDATGDAAPPNGGVERALRRGRTVVTSNPVLAGGHGPRLRALASAAGGELRTRPALAALVRRPSMLTRLATTDRVQRVQAVLSRPLAQLLALLEGAALPLHAALALVPQATKELDGAASGARLALLATAAFDEPVQAEDVLTLGLGWLDHEQVQLAGTKRWRLVATAVRGQCARVEPAVLSPDHPLAATDWRAPVLVTCERAGTVALEPAAVDGAAATLMLELRALAVRAHRPNSLTLAG